MFEKLEKIINLILNLLNYIIWFLLSHLIFIILLVGFVVFYPIIFLLLIISKGKFREVFFEKKFKLYFKEGLIGVLKVGIESYLNYQNNLFKNNFKINNFKITSLKEAKPNQSKLWYLLVFLFLFLAGVNFFNIAKIDTILKIAPYDMNVVKELDISDLTIKKGDKIIYDTKIKYSKIEIYKNKDITIIYYSPSFLEIPNYIKNKFIEIEEDFYNLKGTEFIDKYYLKGLFIIGFLFLIFIILGRFYFDHYQTFKYLENKEKELEDYKNWYKEISLQKEKLENEQNKVLEELEKYKDKIGINLETLKYQLDKNIIEKTSFIGIRSSLEHILKNKFLSYPYSSISKNLYELIKDYSKDIENKKIRTYMNNIRYLGNEAAHNNITFQKHELLSILSNFLEVLKYFEKQGVIDVNN